MKYRALDVFLGGITLCSTGLFFIPLSLFLLNQQEFFSQIGEVAGYLALFSVGAAVLLTVLLLLIGKSSRRVTVAALAFLSVGIWVQGYLLNWDYGSFDGSALDFQLMEWRSADLLLWVVLAVLILGVGIWKQPSFRLLFLLLLFIQGGNTLYAFRSAESFELSKQNDETSAGVSDLNQYTFSRYKNIIILLLDAYQTDFFNEYLAENPEFKAQLPGFTYYPDALATDYFTFRSLPALLSGKVHTFQTSFSNYLMDAYRNHSLPARLHQAGYYVGIYNYYTFAQGAYQPRYFQGIADNYTSDLEHFEPYYWNEIKKLLATTFFRVMPHVAKNTVYTQFLLETSLDQDRDVFIQGVRTYGRVEGERPRFNFYHLQGFHGPWIIGEEELDHNDRDQLKRVIRLLGDMIAEFIVHLKGLGIYEDTALFIVGDHGLLWSDDGIHYGNYDVPERHEQRPLHPFAKKPRAMSLVLFKPPNAQGDLVVSDKGVSLLDIVPTALDVAGLSIDSYYDGISLLRDDTQPRPRPRPFFSSEYKTRTTSALYEYIVPGFSWYDHSWIFTGNAYERNGLKRVIFDNYQPGTTLSFGPTGTGLQYLGEGWVAARDNHKMTGRDATVHLPVEVIRGDATLRLVLSAENKGNQPAFQRINIYVNQKKVRSYAVGNKKEIVTAIPAGILDQSNKAPAPLKAPVRPEIAPPPQSCDTRIEIRLETATAVPPEAEKGNSNREAAVFIHSLTLE